MEDGSWSHLTKPHPNVTFSSEALNGQTFGTDGIGKNFLTFEKVEGRKKKLIKPAKEMEGEVG